MSLKDLHTGMLDDMEIVYESKNNGEHLLIPTVTGLVDFWPSTGKYHIRQTGQRGTGIDFVMKYAGAFAPPAGPALSDISISATHQREKELETLLGFAWELLNNKNAPWPVQFAHRVETALNLKPRAHSKSSPRAPWEE